MTSPPVTGASAGKAPAAELSAASRVDSVDVLRGLAMVLMAVDHVRDFAGPSIPFFNTDVEKTGAALFMTRWITHFCAPAFVLLAGTGAFLQAARGKRRGELSRFLVTRGLWLVLLELTVIELCWTFDAGYHFFGLGVIWAIGWSMVALAALSYLPARLVLVIGAVLILGHNLLDGVKPEHFGRFGVVWSILHAPKGFALGSSRSMFVVYPLVPWVGVMAAGYGLGQLLGEKPETRRRTLFQLGAALSLAFVALRGLNVYGDPSHWKQQSTVLFTALAFLNCTKYPPSLLYLLMTLGPALVLLGLLDGRDFPGKPVLLVFGRVPLLYYLLHLPLAHLFGSGLYLCVYGPVAATWVHGPPPEKAFGLWVVYATTGVLVALLYPLCRWFGDLKRRRRDLTWLSYL